MVMITFKKFKSFYRFVKDSYRTWIAKQQELEIFYKYSNLTRFHVVDSHSSVGEFTYGIPQIVRYSEDGHLTIGKFCCIADDVKMLLGGQHDYKRVSQYAFIPKVQEMFSNFQYSDKPVKDICIGNDVWIGRNVTILQGVTIGDGAVVGTNALVTKDIPPCAIVGGVPCKLIGYRFDEHQIKALLRIKWWDWPIGKIRKNIDLIMGKDINRFITEFAPD